MLLETGLLLDSISFFNTKDGCEKLLTLFERLGVVRDDVVIGMEATGHYWLSDHAFFLELGYNVKVHQPYPVRSVSEDLHPPDKERLKRQLHYCSNLALRQFSATNLSEESIVALRQFSRYRLALVDSCGDCKRRVVATKDKPS